MSASNVGSTLQGAPAVHARAIAAAAIGVTTVAVAVAVVSLAFALSRPTVTTHDGAMAPVAMAALRAADMGPGLLRRGSASIVVEPIQAAPRPERIGAGWTDAGLTGLRAALRLVDTGPLLLRQGATGPVAGSDSATTVGSPAPAPRPERPAA
jgi:hypothetical protein